MVFRYLPGNWKARASAFPSNYYLQTPLAPLYFGCEHPPPPAEDEDEGGVEVDPLRCCCCCWVCMSRENSWKLMRPSPSKSASSIMDRTSWSVNGSPRLFMVNLENQMNLFWIPYLSIKVGRCYSSDALKYLWCMYALKSILRNFCWKINKLHFKKSLSFEWI